MHIKPRVLKFMKTLRENYNLGLDKHKQKALICMND